MSKKPLRIDWKDMLPAMDDGPPLEVEVVASTRAEGSEVAQASDHELQLRIQRVEKHLLSEIGSRLVDNGAKLRASLQQMRAELDRRKRVRDTKDAGGCSRVTMSKNTESPGTSKDCMENHTLPETHAQPSFTSLFLEKLQADAAFHEELKTFSHDRNEVPEKNELQKNVRGHHITNSSQKCQLSSNRTHFQCGSRFTKKDQKRSVSSDCGDSFVSSLPKGKNYSNSKRRRASDEGRKSVMNFKKVSEVVLLDEEEIHPARQTEDSSEEWKAVQVYYPSRCKFYKDDPESVELSYTDIRCLDPESYLSSPIMNFYIRYLQRTLSMVDRLRGDYYFFNTYFYNKLEEAVSYKAKKTCFEKLRRWWKGVNIFQKSYIFIPVHREMHWSLVIICIPAKEDESGPVVLHLDSLGIHNSYLIFDVIDKYLIEEWNYMNEHSPPSDMPFSEKISRHFSRRIEKNKLAVPQQKNDYDCGLFVLYFMERFIEEAPERLRRKDLTMFGNKWFRPEDASGLRKRIKDLLLEEFRCAKNENHEAESVRSGGASEDD